MNEALLKDESQIRESNKEWANGISENKTSWQKMPQNSSEQIQEFQKIHFTRAQLKSLTNHELHESFKRATFTERKITGLVLDHIIEVDERRMYLQYNCVDLYSYLIQEMSYCESSAYKRIQSAKLLKNHSDLKEKVREGSLNLTQLTQLNQGLKQAKKSGKVITPKQAEEIIQNLENKTSFETKQIIAQTLELPIVEATKIKPQRDESIRIEVTFTKEQYDELKKAKDLLSHVVADGNLAEVITLLAKKLNQAKLGKEKEAEAETKTAAAAETESEPTTQSLISKTNLEAEVSHQTKPASKRKYLSIKDKRELFQKANYQCQFRAAETGERCPCTYQLQVDHIVPLAKGGADHKSNMRILCSAHNQAEARRWGLVR